MSDSCTDVVFPTYLDNIHAIMYAIDRIKKERCNDPDILKKYPGIKWDSREENRIYPCPAALKDKCDHGRCIIADKETCMSQSQVPFGPDGGELPTKSCSEDKDCKGLDYEARCDTEEKKCIPTKSYLEWHDEKCILGNTYLRRWCEFPAQRRDEAEHGVTDVPPFKYVDTSGTCQITKPYCDWMGVSYKENDNGRPNCYTTTGQDVGEFIMGKTIFRGIKKITEGFNNLPQQITKLSDRNYAKTYAKLSDNYGGPGIHLYQVVWKPEVADGSSAVFFSDEIEKVYPEIIITKNGAKYINVSREQVKVNPKLKRIYLISGSGKWFLSSIINMSKDAKK